MIRLYMVNARHVGSHTDGRVRYKKSQKLRHKKAECFADEGIEKQLEPAHKKKEVHRQGYKVTLGFDLQVVWPLSLLNKGITRGNKGVGLQPETLAAGETFSFSIKN
eukprot:1153861-Pelagomonas_calceolata.AAC.2